MDALDRGGEQRRHAERRDLRQALFFGQTNGIGDHHRIDVGVTQTLDGRAAQHTVHGTGMDAARAGGFQGGDGGHQGAAGGNLIFKDHHVTTAHVANHLAVLDVGVADAALVDDRHRDAEALGEAPDALGAAGVSGYRDHVGQVVMAAEMLGDGRDGGEVIDRNAEKAMHLVGVQIHGEHTVGTGGLEHVGDEAAGDGDARRVLLVGARIGVIRDHRGDALRRGAAHGVERDHQLHDVLAHRLGEGLYDIHVALAHILLHLHAQVVIGEA